MMDIQTAHNVAFGEATAEAKMLEDIHGDGFPCGFAWVSAIGVKGNTKLGKQLKEVGFKKSYTNGGLQMWNPSKTFVQNVNIKEQAAQKYADIFEKLTGIKLVVSSRLD